MASQERKLFKYLRTPGFAKFLYTAWLVSVLVTVGIALGYYARPKINSTAREIKTLFEDLTSNPLVAPPVSVLPSGYRRHTNFRDSGYLLLSAYLADEERVGIRLIDLSDGLVVKRWYPDPVDVRRASDYEGFQTPNRFEPQSPYLMEDGGLVFIDNQGPLVRINACDDIEWILEGQFHHSLERDLQGNFVVPTVIPDFSPTPLLPQKYRDDAVATVSVNGELLETVSVARLLIDSGYEALIHTAYPFEEDFAHLNDVEVAETTTSGWRRGDWILSLRILNTVFIYRPSIDKIVWLKTGPWLKQHDPDFLDNGTIAIFGNDVVGRGDSFARGHSSVYIIDPKTNDVEVLYPDVMKSQEVGTETQGLIELMDNGDVFIEETDRGRLLRVGESGVVWSYHNTGDEGAGVLNWSRYLDASEVAGVDLNCRSGFSRDHAAAIAVRG